MDDKFFGKYRIPSARWQQWDYRWSGGYFITICTKNRQHDFGTITNGKMQLSGIGILADVFWHEIKHHALNVELDAFVVMPNHVHMILILNGGNDDGYGNVVDYGNNDGNGNVVDDGNNDGNGNVVDDGNNDGNDGNVETGHALSLQPQQPQQPQQSPKSIGHQRFQNIGKNSVSSIIGSYKSAVSKHARRLGFSFQWQTRFHDHVIRDEAEYQRIANYIQNNAQNWNSDSFFKT